MSALFNIWYIMCIYWNDSLHVCFIQYKTIKYCLIDPQPIQNGHSLFLPQLLRQHAIICSFPMPHFMSKFIYMNNLYR